MKLGKHPFMRLLWTFKFIISLFIAWLLGHSSVNWKLRQASWPCSLLGNCRKINTFLDADYPWTSLHGFWLYLYLEVRSILAGRRIAGELRKIETSGAQSGNPVLPVRFCEHTGVSFYSKLLKQCSIRMW